MNSTPSLFLHCFRNERYDSICKMCFITVASQQIEDDLAKAEGDHICDRHLIVSSNPGNLQREILESF